MKHGQKKHRVKDEAKIQPVMTLAELKHLAIQDKRYERLLCISSSNLGGPKEGLDACYRWLGANANETNEAGVVAEVNACIDLVDEDQNTGEGK